MADILHFRSAFNGFNREDVVHYIEYLNNAHDSLVQQLQADLAAAQQEPVLPLVSQDSAEIASLREQCAQQETLLAAMNAEKEALMARCVQLEAALSAQKEMPVVPAAPVEIPVVAPAPKASTDDELAAYRRAERVEREANDRAQAVYHRLQELLSDAATQTDVAVNNLDSIAQQVNNQLATLRKSLVSSKSYLEETAASVKETTQSAE